MKTKDKVYELLKHNANSFVSGEEIASKLFLTRAGVWKAIKGLRDEGKVIEAVTNKGYCLVTDEDILSKAIIGRIIEESGINLKTVVLDEIDSTNNYAKFCAENGEDEDCVYISGYQTGGRGRRGRNFFSPKGTGVYFSFLLHPKEDIAKATRLTCMIAVAACEGIKQATGLDVSIKWVNDLFYKEKKISGILSEAFTSIEDGSLSYVVVGIGINVYEPKDGFPDEISQIAGALLPGCKKQEGIRNKIVANVCSEFMKLYRSNDTSYLEKYKEKSFLIGHYVMINPNNANLKREYALVTGIDDECRLLVKYEDGRTDALSNGEVSVVKY